MARYQLIEDMKEVEAEITSSTKKHLKDIISQGVKWKIFEAEGAIKLYEEIAKHKNYISKNKFDDLFGFLQNALLAQTMLAINKIYEAPSKRNQLRSIPVALKLLQNQSPKLKIEHREQLEEKLTRWGVEEDLKTKLDQEVTKIVAKRIEKMLLEKYVSRALGKIKTFRDKRIAHPDLINETDLPQVLWEEIEKLLELAKIVVGVIGNNYLNVPYELDGEYELSYNASRIGNDLSRLLEKTLDVPTKLEPDSDGSNR